MSKIASKIEEFAAIAKTLPDNLQQTCFQLLLSNYLESLRPSPPPGAQALTSADPKSELSPPLPAVSTAPPADTGTKQEDIKSTDLHVKVKKFLEKYSVSLEQLNNLYFREDGQFKPLYEDLKTTRMSESQIRVTLLIALRQSLATGDFEASADAVKLECTERKCYDANFGNNFNNNKALFDFQKYGKDVKTIRLSEGGKAKLAALIGELQ